MKKIKIFVTSMSLLLIMGTVSVSAAQLMTYNGTSIWDKYSVGTFSLNNSSNTITIKHTNSASPGSAYTLNVKVCKENWMGLFNDVKATNPAKGTGSWTFTNSSLPSGVYKLLFQRDSTVGTFDISGSVSN